MITKRETSIIVLILSLITIANGQLNATTFTLTAITCDAANQTVKVGDLCQFKLTIGIPAGNITTIYIEIFPSDLNTTYAQLCKPSIQYDNAKLSLTLPQPQMIGDYLSKSQFDRAILDFGTVTNVDNLNAAYMYVTFNVVIIGNYAAIGQAIWVSTGVEYDFGNDAWVGQTALYFTSSIESGNSAPSGTVDNTAQPTLEIGKTGTLRYSVNIPQLRYFSLNAIASSNDPAVSVCTVHVQAAGVCFDCLNSVRAALTSTINTATNTATLDLGFLINTGFNNKSINISTTSSIDFFVTYKVLTSAQINTAYSVSLTVSIGNTVGNSFNTNLTGTNTFTAIATSTETSVLTSPTIIPSLTTIDMLPISVTGVYQPFKLTLRVTIPTNFNNYMRLDVLGNTTDGTPRMKICYINISFTGENLPCSSCLNLTSQYSYSENAITSAYDRVSWEVINVKNTGLRSTTENSTANDLVFDIYGQLIDNPDNTLGSNTSVISCLTYGSQSLWLGETFFTVGLANYSSGNISTPVFNVDYYDAFGNTSTDYYQTRLIYLDILTQPGAVYQPMTIEVATPEIGNGTSIPAATICKVKVLSVGKYAQCIQPGIINYNLNGFITYQANMIQYKKDTALVKLGSVCNIGITQSDSADGKIRLLLYIQMEYDSTAVANNYIGVSAQYSGTEIYVGHLLLVNNLINPPTSNLDISHLLYYYFNTTSSISTINAGNYGIANIVFKVPPKTKNIYNFETTLKSSLTSGTASFCTMRFTDSGDNVPCQSIMKHNYDYMSTATNKYKYYDYSYAGMLCSLSNSAIESYTKNWDDDSINIELTTKTSPDAAGAYTIIFTVYNGVYNASFASQTFSWTVASNSNVVYDNFSISNSSNVSLASVALNTNMTGATTDFYKGQTTILLYTIILNESKSFDLSLSVNSTLPADTFDILRFFITNIGDNLPCTYSKSQSSNYLMGSKYVYTATLNVGPFCYYPIDPTNITSSTLSVEAHIRIPSNSSLANGASAIFTMTAYLNGIINPLLTQSVSGIVKDPAPLIVPLSSKNITFTTNTNTSTLLIHNNLTFNSVLCIPAFTSVRTVFKFQSIDNSTNKQFGDITSASIISIGQNVDGISDDYFKWNLISPVISTVASPSFYNDTVQFDLGIVTNTQFGQKVDNYTFNDDCIEFSINVMVTDNAILNNGQSIQAKSLVNFGSSDLSSKQFINTLTVSRSGTEQSIINFQPTVQNQVLAYTVNSTLSVNFMVQHDTTTTAEAYNLTIRFFIPPFVSIENGSINLSSNLTHSSAVSMLTYSTSVLYFGQVLGGSFKLKIDEKGMYSKYLQTYGSVPSQVEIPYTVEFQKLYRSLPSPGDVAGQIYFTPFETLTYIPESVVLVFANVIALKSSIKPCQITASVNNPTASQVFTTGWKTDYRANAWYQANSNYLTIAFGNETEMNRIIMTQFLASTITTPFKTFKVSYSNDNVSYAYLPETSYPTAYIPAPFTYVMPNGNIKCRYLRIHLTSIETPSDLATKYSGLIIQEIYGAYISGGYSLTSVCPSGQVPNSAYYVSRSVLYLPNNSTIFVCDEVPDRKSSVCYMGTNTDTSTWTILSPTVSTIVFWLFDNELFVEYLYGVGYDKKTYVRSDDNGFTWKSISPLEFTTVLSNAKINTQKFTMSYYNPLPTTTLTSLSLPSGWTVSPKGIYFSASNVVDWFT